MLEERPDDRAAQEPKRRNLALLDAMCEGMARLTQSINMIELAMNIVRTCVEIFGADLAWIARTEDNGAMALVTHYPKSETFVKSMLLYWDDSLVGQESAQCAFHTLAPFTIEDTATHPATAPWRDIFLESGLVCCAAFPLFGHESPFGTLTVLSRRSGFFTADRTEFLRAYTNHAATALENARLFEEVQRELRERKRAEEVIRRHSEEISARNRELLDFAYTVSHDVRSPLVAIVQYARILLEEYDSRKDGKEFLGRILEQGESALAFIARLLELAKAGQITGALETVDLNCTFERISAVLRIEGRPLEIVIPSRLPLIKADSLRIEQALRNMAANAAAAAREPDGRGKDADSAGGAGQCSEPPILTVTWEDAGDHLVFTLRDNGRGIDEKDLEKIFRPGYTGARAAEFGKGFGLSIARKMIEGHGGRLWATSPGEGKGASFHFSIPYDKDAHSS